jgi:hypothetical protein
MTGVDNVETFGPAGELVFSLSGPVFKGGRLRSCWNSIALRAHSGFSSLLISLRSATNGSNRAALRAGK